MPESSSDPEVDEVLAAIRRLIVQGPARGRAAAPAASDPLVLTPELRADAAPSLAEPLLLDKVIAPGPSAARNPGPLILADPLPTGSGALPPLVLRPRMVAQAMAARAGEPSQEPPGRDPAQAAQGADPLPPPPKPTDRDLQPIGEEMPAQRAGMDAVGTRPGTEARDSSHRFPLLKSPDCGAGSDAGAGRDKPPTLLSAPLDLPVALAGSGAPPVPVEEALGEGAGPARLPVEPALSAAPSSAWEDPAAAEADRPDLRAVAPEPPPAPRQGNGEEPVALAPAERDAAPGLPADVSAPPALPPSSDSEAAIFAAVLAAAAETAPAGPPGPTGLTADPRPSGPPPAPASEAELRALVADLVREEVGRELSALREALRAELREWREGGTPR